MDVLNARLTRDLRMSRSPTCTGWMKSIWSIAAVTTCVREWRNAAMAPVRSIKCIRRPPRRLPRVFASLGRIISVISDSESVTRRGGMLDSGELMLLFAPILRGSDYNSSRTSDTGLFNVDYGRAASGYNGRGGGQSKSCVEAGNTPNQFRQSPAVYANPPGVRLSHP